MELMVSGVELADQEVGGPQSVARAGVQEGELELPSLHWVDARASPCGSDSTNGGARWPA